MKAIHVLVLGVAFCVSVPIIAWASHGKVGLWEINVQTNMGAVPGMPDMSKLPPEAQARMKAMGIQMNGNGITMRHCMTPAEVNNDKPDLSRNKDCKTTNVRMTGRTFSADLVCTGRINGKGHIEVTYDSPEHYTALETMSGTAGGHPVNNSTKMTGRWLSANCGKVQ